VLEIIEYAKLNKDKRSR